jgi:hypothetical protein
MVYDFMGVTIDLPNTNRYVGEEPKAQAEEPKAQVHDVRVEEQIDWTELDILLKDVWWYTEARRRLAEMEIRKLLDETPKSELSEARKVVREILHHE